MKRIRSECVVTLLFTSSCAQEEVTQLCQPAPVNTSNTIVDGLNGRVH